MRPALTHVGGPHPGAAAAGAEERPRVSTWLAGRDRTQADAVAGAGAVLTHRDTLAALLDDVARGGADAVLVSAALVRGCDVRALARLVRGHPTLPVAGVVTAAADPGQALAAAHALGVAGVPTVFDCRAPGGWAALRGALARCAAAGSFHRLGVVAVLDAIGGSGPPDGRGAGEVPAGLARFFALAFAPDAGRVQALAARLDVCPQTLTSRFFRAGLPSPKRYLTWARLAWAAKLGENPALTVAAIAERLDASSPQSYSRTLRLHTGLSPREFRRRFSGAALLAHYCATLVVPHRERLRTVDPLGTPGDGDRLRAVPAGREGGQVPTPAHRTGRACIAA